MPGLGGARRPGRPRRRRAGPRPCRREWRGTSRTPRVFCAVTAVTTKVPNTPRAAKVRRSAATPAPAPESVPAMVRATFGVGLGASGWGRNRLRSRRGSYGQRQGARGFGRSPRPLSRKPVALGRRPVSEAGRGLRGSAVRGGYARCRARRPAHRLDHDGRLHELRAGRGPGPRSGARSLGLCLLRALQARPRGDALEVPVGALGVAVVLLAAARARSST